MKRFFQGLSVFLAVTFLASCASHVASVNHCHPAQQAPIINNEMMVAFAKNDILLIPKGEQLRIILPDDKFFRNNLPAIKVDKYSTLDQLAKLLAKYPDCAVKIMGYSDDVGNKKDLQTMSLNRARAILTYLWTQGLDADHLYAIGYGSYNTVGDVNNTLSNSANNRIEIIVHARCSSCL